MKSLSGPRLVIIIEVLEGHILNPSHYRFLIVKAYYKMSLYSKLIKFGTLDNRNIKVFKIRKILRSEQDTVKT